MRIGLLAVTLLIWGSCSALAAPLDLNTHTAAVPEQSYQTAKVWFLPDWQSSTSTRTDSAPAESGDIPIKCAFYSPACVAPKILGGKKIRVGNLFCSSECVCPADYQYTSTNCSGDKRLDGSPCNGKYKSCVALSCTEQGLKDCNGKCIAKTACCTNSDCTGNKACTNNTCKGCVENYKLCGSSCIADSACCTNGQTGCGNDNTKKCDSETGTCTDKECDDYNSNNLSERKPNHYCPQVKADSVGGLTCYTCPQTCEAKYAKDGYATDTTCAEGQTTVTGENGCGSWKKCTGEACPAKKENCDYGCKTEHQSENCNNNQKYCKECNTCNKCLDYNETQCPAGWICESCENNCETTTVTKYKPTQCDSANHYVDDGKGGCRLKTCEEGTYLSNIPNGQSCKSVTFAGKNCYTDCKASDPTAVCKAKIVEKDTKAAFVSTEGQFIDALNNGKNVYLTDNMTVNSLTVNQTTYIRDLTFFGSQISECKNQTAKTLSVGTLTAKGYTNVNVDSKITKLDIYQSAEFTKKTTIKDVLTSKENAELYIFAGNTTIDSFSANQRFALLQISSNVSNPEESVVTIKRIQAGTNGGFNLQVYGSYLKNPTGLMDNSKYTGAIQIELYAAIYETRSSRSDAVCFARANPNWSISIIDSCVKGLTNDMYCSNGANLTTVFQQIIPPYGECSQYEYCIDMYDNYCIRGGVQLQWYSSYPY